MFCQSQQLQMLPMSSPDVNPGATETQQMRVIAPVGVSPHSLLPELPAKFCTGEHTIAATDIVRPGRSANTRTGRLCRLPPGADW